MNANAMYEQLLTEQEAVKAKKGIKPKVKGIPAYADGKRSSIAQWLVDEFNSNQTGTTKSDAKKQAAKNILENGFTPIVNWLKSKSGDARAMDKTPYRRNYVTGSVDRDVTALQNFVPTFNNSVDAITGETIPVGGNEPVYDLPEVSLSGAAPITKVKSVRKHTPASKPAKATNSLNQAPLLDIEDFNPTLTPDEIKTSSKSSFGFGSLSGLSPILYNWIQSRRRPEVEDQVINPYTGAINRAMASRKLNIEPTLAANRRSRAIARNNMARLNPNTGMNLAYGNQLATGEYAQNTSVYANRDNANNQYLGEYANMMNNLGQQYVQNTVLTNDLNARNRAAARNFGATAAGQLGQWSQTKEKMRNQARRDRQILPYLQNFLRYGTVNSLVDSLTV